ncbi:MAG: ABC transporter permease [Acidobacteriota bacterium]|nr:ABC transporter permease [Acidobacteriota bacterium]
MRFESKLAWRYFRARRKSLARFTSFVAVVGIAAGVASLIIAQSLARGFSDEMQDKILANTAHVSVFLNDGTEILDWQEIIEKLRKSENVKEVSATTYESAVVVGTQTTSYAVLRVIEGQGTRVEGRGLRKSLLQTLDPRPLSLVPIEIALGKELAEKTNLKIGDEAEIITFENEFAPTTSKVFIKEIFQTGLYEYDSTWVYISPEEFARLKTQKNFTPTILSVSVKDIYAANKTADEIRANLGDNFKIVDWQEANRPLFAALSLERRVALAIISLIIFIAALNITTTLALLAGERRFDIAILRTCGARMKSLIFIFLLEGLLLGFTGIFFGLGLGLLGCFLGNYFKVIRLSAEVYSLDHIPFHPDLNNILLIISIAFLVCLAATVYPALKISKIKPLENLRRQ